MSYIDIILCIPLLWGLYKGFTKGFIIQIASLAALALGIYGGVVFSDSASGFIQQYLTVSNRYAPLIAFGFMFIAIVLVVFLLAKLLEKIVRLSALGLMNKLSGSLFGAMKWGMMTSVALVIAGYADARAHFIPPEEKAKSVLYQPVSEFVPILIPAIKTLVKD